MLDHEQYNEAIDAIMDGRHFEGFSRITELYEVADMNERESILSMLMDVFYIPNFEMLKGNYESNRKALSAYPYWFGPQVPEIHDIGMIVFPVLGNIWFLYDNAKCEFKQIEVNSEIETKYFFRDLSKPVFVQDETNEFNLRFVMDNVRPSEHVAMDNHIYLYYENPAEFFCVMQAFTLYNLFEFKKTVFLIGEENKELYPLNFKERYNIDYSRMPKKTIGIGDIKRLFFGWVIHGFSGASFLAQIIDFPPEVLTHPNDTLERFYLLKDILAGVEPAKFIDSFFLLPSNNAFRAEITKLVCYGKEIKSEIEKSIGLNNI